MLHNIRCNNDWQYRQSGDEACARIVGFGSADQDEIVLVVDYNPEDNNYNFKVNYVNYGDSGDDDYRNQVKSDTSRYSDVRDAQEAADLWWSNHIKQMIESVVAW